MGFLSCYCIYLSQSNKPLVAFPYPMMVELWLMELKMARSDSIGIFVVYIWMKMQNEYYCAQFCSQKHVTIILFLGLGVEV